MIFYWQSEAGGRTDTSSGFDIEKAKGKVKGKVEMQFVSFEL